MEQDEKNTYSAPSADPDEQPVAAKRDAWWAAVLVGVALTLLAWGMLMFNEHISFWSGLAGLVVSCFGLKARGRMWHNVAITCVIATAVLMLVYAIFFGALFFALQSL